MITDTKQFVRKISVHKLQ